VQITGNKIAVRLVSQAVTVKVERNSAPSTSTMTWKVPGVDVLPIVQVTEQEPEEDVVQENVCDVEPEA
jgi:hypothetical protein